MKIIVTHSSPDMDAIMSVWLIRKFLPGWENAVVQFVPAGESWRRLSVFSSQLSNASQSVNRLTGKLRTEKLESDNRQQKTDNRNPIERIKDDEVIHVDTGLGPLDHHQTASDKVCAASLTFDYVKKYQISERSKDRMEAVGRMVRVVVDIDHFKEVFWQDPLADYHDFSLVSILDGLKLQRQDQDAFYVEFVSDCLDAVLHEFENRIWAEKEIAKNGVRFKTRFGKGIGFETINDSVIKLGQKMGYVVVVRKDPRKGYVRIKASPLSKSQKYAGIDLTLAYEKLKKMDPSATWFLHIGKKMLLNGSVKNPKMRPTKLGLSDIIGVLEEI